MAIKPEADQSYFMRRATERALASLLDEGFDITFGSGWGGLSMWLAEPKPHMRERFGFAKEVLTLYSKHERTDARVLTTIEHISRTPEFKHRMERAIVLVIHCGDADVTRELVQEHPDWIVVPIAASELTDPQRGALFIRARIADVVGTLDLFGMSSPITSDRYFFGRNDLVQQLIVRLTERQENAGLFGLRKTGKTSVLFAIVRRLQEQPTLTEYIDCQNPGIHAARWWQVLETISERCADSLKRDRKRTVATSQYDERNAGNLFLKDVRALLGDGELGHVALLFDEIEYMTPGISGPLGQHWDIEFVPFWQTIRAVHHEVKGRLTFCVAGVNPAAVTTSHFGEAPNPIFQLATPTYLSPLEVPQVRDMVRTIGRYSGLNIEEPVYRHLTDTYGGHPFLIRIACSEATQAVDTKDPKRRGVVGIQTFDGLQEIIRARLERPIRDILLSLVWWYPEEYDLLLILAEGDERFVDEYLGDDRASILRFAHYGLLSHDGREFAIKDLQEFLEESGGTYKRQISPFRRGDLPPDLLPEVPDLDVLGELFERRTEIELKLRRVIVLYLGVKFNWDDSKVATNISTSLSKRSDRQEPSQMFVGRRPKDVMNELFTLDLKDIVLKNWDSFGGLFDLNKNRFRMNMDTLNKARRIDGHSKPVSKTDYEDIQNSYGWLQARLANVNLPAAEE